MKKLLILYIFLISIFFSCQKDPLKDPNGKILLSIESSSRTVTTYTYNDDNQLIKLYQTYKDNFTYSVDFIYSVDEKIVYLDVTESDSTVRRDSIIYNIDKRFYTYWGGSLGKQISYLDENSRKSKFIKYDFINTKNQSFKYSNIPSDSVLYSYPDYNTQVAVWVGNLDTILGTISTDFDNNKNPYEVLPFIGEYMLGNPIRSRLNILVEDGEKYFTEFKFNQDNYIEYNYDYNVQGYPTRRYNTSSRRVTSYEYRAAN